MKLLVEQFEDYNTLYEADGDKKSLFIEGVFMQADIKNRNGRIYPKHVLAKEANRYIKESIERRNAFGELNHPPTPQINLDRVSHMIVNLKEDGSNFIGKAKILETPMGLIVKNIVEGGGQLAVSSRGTGSLRNVGGTMQVQEDFRLATAADIVSTPSAPSAYVTGIMESPDWIFDNVKQEWVIAEVLKEIHNTKPSQINEEKALRLLSKFVGAFDTESFLNEDASGLTPEQKTRSKQVSVRKSGGDDAYSWAMFVNGREVYNGMSKSEATWRKNTYIKDGSPLKRNS